MLCNRYRFRANSVIFITRGYRSHLEKTEEFGVCKVVDKSFRPGFMRFKLVDTIVKYCQRRFNISNNFIWNNTATNSLTRFVREIYYRNKMSVEEDNFSTNNCSNLRKFVPNDAARKMTKLDRSLFTCPVKVLGISVPNNYVERFRKIFKTSILRISNIKPVASLDESDPSYNTHRLVMLNSDLYKAPEEFISKYSGQLIEISVEPSSCKLFDLTLDYTNWNYNEILRSILPEGGVDGIGGFSIIGHIAHLNIKDELLGYKYIIGEVLLDKISTVETVINKLDTINNTFRNFKMEVLAGKEEFVTVTKEHGYTYEFDFSKIYWNPRLSTEHQRITSLISSNDVLFDVFAGVGPFVVPSAKKGCQVFANDLNPDSTHWLDRNLNINKVKREKVQVYNMDGREFITNIIKKELRKLLLSSDGKVKELDHQIHVTMNLPALAVEFLDSFIGLLANDSDQIEPTQQNKDVEIGIDMKLQNQRTESNINDCSKCSNVIIHCYSFSKDPIPESDVVKVVGSILQLDLLTFYDVGVKRVRNVAPKKEMLCISFKLPWELLLRKQKSPWRIMDDSSDCSTEPMKKKIKT